jgi:chemotaxis protein CheD
MNTINGRRAVAIYLNPAEIVLAEDPATVTTILGSCVAVTLFSPRTTLGAICHTVLPYGSDTEPGRFANQAIPYMLQSFRKKNILPEELVAKVFGGADMFPQMRGIGDTGTIGAQNIQAALATLEHMGINPAVVEVSGQQGRKLVFFSETGDVYIKRVQKNQMLKAEQSLHFCKKHQKSDMTSRNF